MLSTLGIRFGRPALLLGLMCASLGACGSQAEGTAPASLAAAQVTTLDGEAYDLEAIGEPTVFLFVGRVCPISNALVPEMRRIFAEYGERGFDFRLVYTDLDESLEDLRTHLSEYELGMPALLDFGQLLAARFGVSVTPEVALVSADAKLLYRGRINDLYADFGIQRKQPTSHDLRLALDAVLAGEDPDPAQTEAIGCMLPDVGVPSE